MDSNNYISQGERGGTSEVYNVYSPFIFLCIYSRGPMVSLQIPLAQNACWPISSQGHVQIKNEKNCPCLVKQITSRHFDSQFWESLVCSLYPLRIPLWYGPHKKPPPPHTTHLRHFLYQPTIILCSSIFTLLVQPPPPQKLSIRNIEGGHFQLEWEAGDGTNRSHLLDEALDFEVSYKRIWEPWEVSVTILLAFMQGN